MMHVFVTFQIPGFHQWANAPDEHGYLASQHRHVFHFRVDIQVEGHDRSVEMIEFKNIARDTIFSTHSRAFGSHVDFGGQSCEEIAFSLSSALQIKGYNVKKVEVSEDGENGAVVHES